MPKSAKRDARRLKITVLLLQRHIAALDYLAVSIRLRTGVALARAGIIGAFIEASRGKRSAVVEAMIQSRTPESKDRTCRRSRDRNSRRKATWEN